MLTALVASVEQKKARLDRVRPLPGAALAQLQKHYDVELTYTSNAIEGNTLTLRETAEVIEHGITVGGKSLRDHLEAVDHYEAVQWMRELAALTAPVGERTVCELHRRIVARSQPAIAEFTVGSRDGSRDRPPSSRTPPKFLNLWRNSARGCKPRRPIRPLCSKPFSG
jgi:Fic family protein